MQPSYARRFRVGTAVGRLVLVQGAAWKWGCQTKNNGLDFQLATLNAAPGRLKYSETLGTSTPAINFNIQ
jgi:hypothetical protein